MAKENVIINNEKSEFNEWQFIEDFYPDYAHADEIAENDDICKVLHEDIDLNEYMGDEYMLGLAAKPKEELEEMLEESNYALLKEAFRNYLRVAYPKQYKNDEDMPL